MPFFLQNVKIQLFWTQQSRNTCQENFVVDIFKLGGRILIMPNVLQQMTFLMSRYLPQFNMFPNAGKS